MLKDDRCTQDQIIQFLNGNNAELTKYLENIFKKSVKEGFSPLSYAYNKKLFQVSNAIVRLFPKALTKLTDETGFTELQEAIRNGRVDFIRTMLYNLSRDDTDAKNLSLLWSHYAENLEIFRIILNQVLAQKITDYEYTQNERIRDIVQANQDFRDALDHRLALTNHVHAADDATQDYTENDHKPIDAIIIPVEFMSDAVRDLEDERILDIVLYQPGIYALIPIHRGAQRNPDASGSRQYKLRSDDGYVIITFNNQGLSSVVRGVEDPTWMVMMALAFL